MAQKIGLGPRVAQVVSLIYHQQMQQRITGWVGILQEASQLGRTLLIV